MSINDNWWLVCAMAAMGVAVMPSIADASTDDLIPEMASGQAYSERYNFSVDLDGGGHIGMNWTISNLGVRNGYGASQVRVRHPDASDYNHSERETRSNWSYNENSFELDIADATIEAVGDGEFELEYDGGDVKVELTFENVIDMWSPDNGTVEQGSDFYRFTMVSPRADVEGRVRLDGEWHDVTGSQSGYADHVVTNVAPYNLAQRFVRFRQYDDDVFVMWREMALTDDYGGGTPTWVMVGVGDEVAFSGDATVRYGNLERDEETGYDIPHAVQVQAESGSDTLDLRLRKDDHDRTDLLEQHGRIARMIAGSVSDPFQYDVHGDYRLEVDVGDNQLRTLDSGRVTIDYLNR